MRFLFLKATILFSMVLINCSNREDHFVSLERSVRLQIEDEFFEKRNFYAEAFDNKYIDTLVGITFTSYTPIVPFQDGERDVFRWDNLSIIWNNSSSLPDSYFTSHPLIHESFKGNPNSDLYGSTNDNLDPYLYLEIGKKSKRIIRFLKFKNDTIVDHFLVNDSISKYTIGEVSRIKISGSN